MYSRPTGPRARGSNRGRRPSFFSRRVETDIHPEPSVLYSSRQVQTVGLDENYQVCDETTVAHNKDTNIRGQYQTVKAAVKPPKKKTRGIIHNHQYRKLILAISTVVLILCGITFKTPLGGATTNILPLQ